MITVPATSSKEVVELVGYLNKFLPELFKSDELRGEERVKAFVGLATTYDLFSIEDAIAFAMKPIN